MYGQDVNPPIRKFMNTEKFWTIQRQKVSNKMIQNIVLYRMTSARFTNSSTLN